MQEGQDREMMLELIKQMEQKIIGQKPKRPGDGRWLQGDVKNSVPLWPLMDVFIDMAEKHPELAQYGKYGKFLSTPLVRRPQTKDLETQHKKFGGKKTPYTDADGRDMHWKIARRK